MSLRFYYPCIDNLLYAKGIGIEIYILPTHYQITTNSSSSYSHSTVYSSGRRCCRRCPAPPAGREKYVIYSRTAMAVWYICSGFENPPRASAALGIVQTGLSDVYSRSSGTVPQGQHRSRASWSSWRALKSWR